VNKKVALVDHDAFEKFLAEDIERRRNRRPPM
jgi:hypothetical protein